MPIGSYRAVATAVAIALALPGAAAHAQLSGLLNQGSGSTGGLGSLGGALPGGSMTSGSTGNVAGLLQFCIQNNYLSGSSANSVKDSLMGKLGGGASSSPGYSDGASGILESGSGQHLDLSGSGLKQQATKQVCDKVLSQGKSML